MKTKARMKTRISRGYNMERKHFKGSYPARDNPRLYQIWKGMRARCYGKNHKTYYLYGGRGIKVCDEWNSFSSFLKWAISTGYDAKAPYGECTLDRIDPKKDYCPENCRWADAKTQSRNRENIHPVTIDGRTMLMSEWAKEKGIPLSTVYVRLSRGCSIEKALLVRRLERDER